MSMKSCIMPRLVCHVVLLCNSGVCMCAHRPHRIILLLYLPLFVLLTFLLSFSCICLLLPLSFFISHSFHFFFLKTNTPTIPLQRWRLLASSRALNSSTPLNPSPKTRYSLLLRLYSLSFIFQILSQFPQLDTSLRMHSPKGCWMVYLFRMR